MTATATTRSPHRQRPFLPAPAMTLSTVLVGLRRLAGTGDAPARSTLTTSRSARVRAVRAPVTRSANSSSVSVPSAVRSLSSSMTASRSASDTRSDVEAASSGFTAASPSPTPARAQRIIARNAIGPCALGLVRHGERRLGAGLVVAATVGAELSENPSQGWPTGFAPGALRFSRSSVNYEETVAFYRDVVNLPVLDEFTGSFGEDGTIFGLPD